MNVEPKELRIYLLGALKVEVDRCPVSEKAWGRPSARQLLKLLAVQRGYRMHKEQIQDTLWPDLGPDTVNNSFRRALHLCRHALEPHLGPRQPSSLVHARDDLVFLDADNTWVDVHAFEASIQAGLESNDTLGMERALNLYGGAVLPEDEYEDWAQASREHVSSLRLAALVRLGSLLVAQGQLDHAERFLDQAIRQDPAQEEAHRLLILVAGRRGDRSQAQRVYNRCLQALRDEVGVDPGPETESLFERVMEGMVEAAVKPRPARTDPAFTRPRLPTPARHEGAITVGRETEIESVLTWLASRHSSEPGPSAPLLVLSGEMGAGKTHLARLVAGQAYGEGATVLWGGWWESNDDPAGSGIPYLGFIEALDRLAGSPELWARYPEVERLMPSGTAGTDVEPAFSGDDGQSRRARLYSSIMRLFTDMESTGPLLFVLDDVHWCDQASTDLFLFLMRLAQARRWAFLGTARDGGSGKPFGALVDALRRQALVREVAINPLTQDTTSELVERTQAGAGPARFDEIFALSRGNPLFTLELARAPVNGAGSEGIAVPRTLVELLGSRLARVGHELHTILEAGSVLGERWSLPEIAGMLELLTPGSSTQLVVLGLEELSRLGILLPFGDGFEFGHPIYSAVVYESLSGERRRLLHGAAGQTVESLRPDDVQILAKHFERSRDDHRATGYLEAAGDRAAELYANEAAVERYKSALDRLPATRGATRARLEEKLGKVLLTAGRLSQAEDVLESALAFHRGEKDLDASARVLATLGRVLRTRGRAAEAITRFEEVSGFLESGHVAGQAEIKSVLVRLLVTVGRYGEAVAAAEQALELSSLLGNKQIRADSAVARATALLFMGRLDEGKNALTAAVGLARESGDLNLVQVALANLGEVHSMEGHYAEALDFHTQALDIVRRMGDLNRLSFAESAVGAGLMMVGKWQEARLHLEAARAIAEEIESSWYSAYPLIHLGRLEMYSGRMREAERLLDSAARAGEGSHDAQAALFLRIAVSELDLLSGKQREAVDRLRPLMDEGQAGADLGSVLTLAALALSGLGSHEEAIATAERSLHLGEGGGAAADVKEALISLGTVLRAAGAIDRASEVLNRALEMSVSMGDLFGQARAHSELASLQQSPGDERAPGDHAKLAEKLFRRLAARAFLTTVERATNSDRPSHSR